MICWSILLLCLSASAENTVLYRESGESITLECSSAGCASSIEGHTTMYLYKYFREQDEVLYYFTNEGLHDKITPRKGYKNRTQTSGSLKNHTVTISNLTVSDTGIYSCVYKSSDVKCNVYMLVVKEVTSAPHTEVTSAPDTGVTSAHLPLVLIIIATCAISMLVIIIILLIILRVKQWTRRKTTQVSLDNEYVYEVMTRNGLHPREAPECSQPSPYNFA